MVKKYIEATLIETPIKSGIYRLLIIQMNGFRSIIIIDNNPNEEWGEMPNSFNVKTIKINSDIPPIIEKVTPILFIIEKKALAKATKMGYPGK